MTVHTGVAKADAQEMVANGGRILKHYLDAERNPVCDVESLDVVAMATALPELEDDVPVEPKRRGRPKKAKEERNT